ncbi:hypothetical protein [Serratia marcescens]|uniref:hypothetical protein n=1 Tax=Serratia marcescens TaxID=615 RepID=UPI001E5D9B02|nr:hypothetical protein [Serratia marcescens]
MFYSSYFSIEKNGFSAQATTTNTAQYRSGTTDGEKITAKDGLARCRELVHGKNDDASAVSGPETFPIYPFISRMGLLTAHWHIMIYQSAATCGVTSLPGAIYLLEMIFVRSYIAASTASP